VSHLAHSNGSAPISPEEARLAISQGKRLAEIALRLKAGK
jgi:NAD(P)H dehydrogenase (quinone)